MCGAGLLDTALLMCIAFYVSGCESDLSETS